MHSEVDEDSQGGKKHHKEISPQKFLRKFDQNGVFPAKPKARRHRNFSGVFQSLNEQPVSK